MLPSAAWSSLPSRSSPPRSQATGRRCSPTGGTSWSSLTRPTAANASFIGFTGTPIELTDKNTRAVFGEYISVYDIQQAVADGATVPIYYESRIVKLDIDEEERKLLDQE